MVCCPREIDHIASMCVQSGNIDLMKVLDLSLILDSYVCLAGTNSRSNPYMFAINPAAAAAAAPPTAGASALHHRLLAYTRHTFPTPYILCSERERIKYRRIIFHSSPFADVQMRPLRRVPRSHNRPCIIRPTTPKTSFPTLWPHAT